VTWLNCHKLTAELIEAPAYRDGTAGEQLFAADGALYEDKRLRGLAS
jgi:hypothetical protein